MGCPQGPREAPEGISDTILELILEVSAHARIDGGSPGYSPGGSIHQEDLQEVIKQFGVGRREAGPEISRIISRKKIGKNSASHFKTSSDAHVIRIRVRGKWGERAANKKNGTKIPGDGPPLLRAPGKKYAVRANPSLR